MANSSRNRNRPSASPEQAVTEALFRGIGQLFGLIFRLFRGGGPNAGKVSPTAAALAELAEHWQEVELHALQDATRSLAVSEADKIFDAALKAQGYAGETMADRLRAAEKYLPADLYQGLWSAHKLRNSLAHEVGAGATAEQASRAIATFRTALYHLKVLR